MPRLKQWPCLVCEKLYYELEAAEVCERSHAPKDPPKVVDLMDALRKSLDSLNAKESK